jgi:hypothetical protein
MQQAYTFAAWTTYFGARFAKVFLRTSQQMLSLRLSMEPFASTRPPGRESAGQVVRPA